MRGVSSLEDILLWPILVSPELHLENKMTWQITETSTMNGAEKQLRFKFLSGNILQILADNGVCHLPHLQQVVLGCRTQNPGVTEVPAEVRNTVGVTTVHEKPRNEEISQIENRVSCVR